MSYHFGQLKNAAGQLQKAITKIKQGEDLISQVRSKMEAFQEKITFKPEYWTALDKTSSSVQKIIGKLDASKEERRLQKIEMWSKRADIWVILVVATLLGSIVVLSYFTKKN